MREKQTMLRNEKGFTLIEMAIVLVIIGLILGAVIKGKDVINGAKQKKFYTGFVKEWELSVASYYDRTGNLLGDGTVNGGTGTSRDGRFDTIIGSAFGDIDTRLQEVGLEVPVSNTDNSGEYSYSGAYSSGTITMYLYYLPSATDGYSRNTFYYINMPTDLAIGLDTIVDGEADPQKGDFRIYPDTDTTWPDASSTATVRVTYTIDFP